MIEWLAGEWGGLIGIIILGIISYTYMTKKGYVKKHEWEAQYFTTSILLFTISIGFFIIALVKWSFEDFKLGLMYFIFFIIIFFCPFWLKKIFGINFLMGDDGDT